MAKKHRRPILMVKKPQAAPTDPDQPSIPPNAQPVQAPHVFASSIILQSSGNDYTLMFTRSRPLEIPGVGLVVQVAQGDVAAIVTVSPQTLKDMALLLADQVAKYEKVYGEIRSPYTLKRAKDGRSKKGR